MKHHSWRRLKQPISLAEIHKAVELWQQGRDTKEIATILKLPEFQVYNDLPRWRTTTTTAWNAA